MRRTSLHSIIGLLLSLQYASAIRSLLLDRTILTRRGGSTTQTSSRRDNPFQLVAKSIQDRLNQEITAELSEIVDALEMLSSSQQTFKGLDGAAHEAYQRTQDHSDLVSVRGRARRSADRAAATANGLGACELVELLELDTEDEFTRTTILNGTLAGGRRQVIFNQTIATTTKPQVTIVILFEPIYHGDAGILHGGMEEPKRKKNPKGRLLVLVGDNLHNDLTKTLQLLDTPPKHIKLSSGLQSNEVASVQSNLYKTAGTLLETMESILRDYEPQTSAIHFVGRSLAGGIASLAALILDGTLPMPKSKSKKKKLVREEPVPTKENRSGNSTTNANTTTTTEHLPLSGLYQDRTSCVSLGAPPCVSPNVPSDCIISILYGDDVVCRTTRASLDKLLQRTQRALQSKGWIGGKQLNFMTDALSLTMSSLQSHAHGSEGEELRLGVPGRAFLLRPRRYGGLCSIHEVGNRLKGGREALRAQVLWQLDDILLSKSLWKHHQLDSYIHGLDRAHLRGFSDDNDEGEDGHGDQEEN